MIAGPSRVIKNVYLTEVSYNLLCRNEIKLRNGTTYLGNAGAGAWGRTGQAAQICGRAAFSQGATRGASAPPPGPTPPPVPGPPAPPPG